MNLLRAAIVAGALLSSSTARADTEIKTVAAQTGLGLGVGATGTVFGIALGGFAGVLLHRKGDWAPAFVGATLVGTAGAIAGTVYGVTYAGDELDDTGSTLGTTLGATAGFALAVGTEVILRKRAVKLPLPAHIAIFGAAVVSGAVIGYQVTDAGTPPSMPLVGGVF